MSNDVQEFIRAALKIYVDRPLSRMFCDREIESWCAENGWTDPFLQEGNWWAFPPRAVIPDLIPVVYIERRGHG